MHSPIAAFAWELWRKNQRRLILIFGVLIGFIIVYPRLCATTGFNPANSMSIDKFTRDFLPMSKDGPVLLRIGRALLFLFLLAGPITAMFLSLLCVVWMFTVPEFDPASKNSPSIPGRLFTLPISTAFLFLWFFLGGTAMIFVVFEGWIQFVPMPYIDIFDGYQKCLGWMAFLTLAQAVVWSLAAWPVTRFLASMTLLFCFMAYPTWLNPLVSRVVLPLIFVLGAALASVSLRKMRHGQWQGWTWKWPTAMTLVRHELRGPRQFASPAQAQLWFEWRRFARTLCFFVAGVSLVPVAVHWVARIAFFENRPLQPETQLGFEIMLLAIPVVLHALAAASPGRADHPFLMNRPLTGGDMTMAILKAAAISTVLSWVIVSIALAAVPLLGNSRWVGWEIQMPPEYRAAAVTGLVFLTWRVFTVNLCFGRSGQRWLVDFPALILLATFCGAIMIGSLIANDQYWEKLVILVPLESTFLFVLVTVKLFLAFVGFRLSLKRRLLGPSALLSYLAIWVLIVSALLALVLRIPLPSKAWLLPVSLIVVLLVPLARISFCPIAIEHSRQT
ncbi:MAG TPA: hypothetical protein VGO67_24955 [Verrucomicrobiae bacterium]|jgi:hypothetical protein